MNVGFTGTRRGMSVSQKAQLRWLADRIHIHRFHHGDCRGADREADSIIRKARIVIRRHPAKGHPLERNREIVAAVDLLIAAPLTNKEVLRSGTWATVRYARSKVIPIIMLSR